MSNELVVQARPNIEVRVGGVYEYSGERVEVTHCTDTECVIQVFGEKDGRVVPRQQLQANIFQPRELIDLGLLPASEWALACSRVKVVQKIVDQNITDPNTLLKLGRPVGLKPRMLQEYSRRYRAQRSTSSCLRMRGGRQRKTSYLDRAVDRIIDAALQDVIASEEATSMAEICDTIAERCAAQELAVPHRDTVQRRMKDAGLSLRRRKRLGPHKYRESVRALKGRHEVSHPGAEFQIDHTMIDLMALCDLRRYVLGRMWLTLVMDVFSRAVMGFYLSFRAPSMFSVARALTMAVSDKTRLLAQWGLNDLEWPMAGKPLVVHTDHGPEFHSGGYLRGCDEHGMTPRWRLATRYGGHIERLIGTLMGKLHLLPGTTFSNVPKRIKYQPQARAVMTVSDVLRFLACTICEYHHTRHRTLGVTPQMRWQEGQSLVPANCLQPPLMPKLLWDFLPPMTSVRQPDGLHWGGYVYNSRTLLPIPVRTKVGYRIDPWDTRNALVEMPNGTFVEVPRATPVTFDHHELERQYRICRSNGANAADIVVRREKAADKRKSIVKAAKAAAEKQQGDLFAITAGSIGSTSEPAQIIVPPTLRPPVFVRPAIVFNTSKL